MVILNRNRKTGILLSDDGKISTVILMDEAPLSIQHMNSKQLWKDFYRDRNYSVAKAAEHYLKHAAGLTPQAHRELNILCGRPSTSCEIVQGSLPAIKVSKRGSGIINKIWETLDEAWEAAEKPKEKEQLKAIRKTVSEMLVTTEELNKTTVTIQAGNWMKARLA